MTKPSRGPQQSNHSPVPHKVAAAMRRNSGVLFGSTLLRSRDERRRVKQDLRNGREPAPKYTTGKEWSD